jgi:hypothetical protein
MKHEMASVRVGAGFKPARVVWRMAARVPRTPGGFETRPYQIAARCQEVLQP